MINMQGAVYWLKESSMNERKIFWTLIFLCLSCGIMMAQVTTGTISGTARDASGAVMPGAGVSIRHVETGIARAVTTDAEGRYLVPNLALGGYEVEATMSGFQTQVRTGITLTVGQHAVVNFALQPGAVAESVTVMGEAPLVDTATSAVGVLVARQQIQDLPLSGRNYTQLVLLQPGVVQDREQVRVPSRGMGQRMSIAGARPNQTGWRLNGLDIADMAGNTPGSATGSNLGVDAIQEFQVLTNNFSAEHGKAAGGIINMVFKSGTNAFHGSAFEYLRNDKLDARGFFDRTKPPLRRNQFGGSVGGPIRRDRTFFFGSYEGLQERTKETRIANVITREAKEGRVTVGGVPTTVEVAPSVKPYLAIWPEPNGRTTPQGVGEFVQSVTQAPGENYMVVKIDHTFSDSDSLSGSYVLDDGKVQGPSVRNQLSIADEGLRNRYQYVSLFQTHIFSPTALNVFRAGYNRSNMRVFSEPTGQWPENLYFVPAVPSGGGVTIPGFTDFKPVSGIDRDRGQLNSFELGDTVHLTRRAHSIKLGMNAMRLRHVRYSEGRAVGGQYAFASLPDFLRATPTQFEAVDPEARTPTDFFQNLFGFFAQDDVRVSPGLTLNAGLRYEFITLPCFHQPLAGALVNLTDPQLTISDCYIGRNPSLKNFAPRIGFAWDLFGNQQTVLRGGFGLYHDQITSYYMMPLASTNPPIGVTRTLRNPPFPNAYQQIRAGSLPARFSLHSLQYSVDQPYRIQYNLGVQHELLPGTLLAVNYVGARAVHNPQVYANINNRIPTRLPDGRLYFDPASPQLNPNFGNIEYRSTGGDGYYNALQMMVNRRLSAGFQFQASYTWSKNLSTGDAFSYGSEGDNTVSGNNPWDPGSERGLSAFGTPHQFSLNTTYELPFGRGWSGVARALGADWQMGGILTLRTGSIFSPGVGFDQARKLVKYSVRADDQRPDLVAGRSNNPVTGGTRKQYVEQYFDPTAFALPQAGTLGNLGRNTLIGPGMAQMDFNVRKRFRVTESKLLEFRAELFNLLNRANFRIPNEGNRQVFTREGGRNPLAGRLTEVGTARQIQLALRLEF
ncbi:MAG: TonB-dependent receptor [Acidobacteria bacterium]|nr:TonB-dependent receptor [Acidobacteriota bacterium]